MEVVAKGRHGSDAAKGRVSSLGVVLDDPRGKGLEPLVVGAVEPAIRPFGEKRLDDPLGLAVGLRPIGPRPLVAGCDRLDRAGVGRARVGRARVGPGIVDQDALDPDTMTGEPDGRIEQSLAGGARALVRNVGDIGQPGGIVDDDLEMVVPEQAASTARFGRPSSRWPPPSGIRPSFLWSWWTSEPG